MLAMPLAIVSAVVAAILNVLLTALTVVPSGTPEASNAQASLLSAGLIDVQGLTAR